MRLIITKSTTEDFFVLKWYDKVYTCRELYGLVSAVDSTEDSAEDSIISLVIGLAIGLIMIKDLVINLIILIKLKGLKYIKKLYLL